MILRSYTINNLTEAFGKLRGWYHGVLHNQYIAGRNSKITLTTIELKSTKPLIVPGTFT